MGPLKNNNHELFCQARAKGISQVKAELLSTLKEDEVATKTQEASAAVQGVRLSKRPDVKERIRELNDEFLEKLNISEYWIVKRIMKIADDPDVTAQVRLNALIRLGDYKRIWEKKVEKEMGEEEKQIASMSDEDIEKMIKTYE